MVPTCHGMRPALGHLATLSLGMRSLPCQCAAGELLLPAAGKQHLPSPCMLAKRPVTAPLSSWYRVSLCLPGSS